jgi:hypothetical protein
MGQEFPVEGDDDSFLPILAGGGTNVAIEVDGAHYTFTDEERGGRKDRTKNQIYGESSAFRIIRRKRNMHIIIVVVDYLSLPLSLPPNERRNEKKKRTNAPSPHCSLMMDLMASP